MIFSFNFRSYFLSYMEFGYWIFSHSYQLSSKSMNKTLSQLDVLLTQAIPFNEFVIRTKTETFLISIHTKKFLNKLTICLSCMWQGFFLHLFIPVQNMNAIKYTFHHFLHGKEKKKKKLRIFRNERVTNRKMCGRIEVKYGFYIEIYRKTTIGWTSRAGLISQW